MKNQKILELASFKLKEGVNEAEFLNASEKFQKVFVEKQEGYVSRKLVCSNDGTWCDVVTWNTEENAHAVNKAMNENEIAQQYCSFMDFNSVEVKHLYIVKE